MAIPLADHQRFIRAVRRRMLFVRAAESLALALLIGSLLAVVPLLILQWRGLPTFPLLAALLMLCPLAGLAVLRKNWPTPLAAAAQADRQLALSDLLTTAVQIHLGRSAAVSDVLSDAVLTMADARCRTLSPWDVLLRRWGAGAWSGMGLSVALLLAAAMIPLRPVRSDANESVLSQAQPGIAAAISPAGAWPQIVAQNSASDDASRIISVARLAARSSAASVISQTRSASGSEPSTASQDSTKPSAESADSRFNSQETSNGNGNSGGSISPRRISLPAWNSGEWPRVAAGNSAAPDTEVPASCRDLVHEYFDRFGD